MTEDGADPEPEINTAVPHSARIWNYWLGGTDNYPVDREAGDRYRAAYPGIVDTALAARQFMARAVRFLAGEAGIRQFLDVGAGLPAADNTHQVAQRDRAGLPVVYADNDPLVLAHARDLLTSTAEGACAYVHADMREPRTILTAAAGTLDLAQPTAVLLLGALGHVSDYAEARSIVSGLLDGLPPGSYLALADSSAAARPTARPGSSTPRPAPSRTSSAAGRDPRLLRRPRAGRARRGADSRLAARSRPRPPGPGRRARRGSPHAGPSLTCAHIQ